MEEKHSESQNGFVIRIGKLLREALDIQKKQIEEATYNCVKPSDLEAGEIIAKKVFKIT